MPRSEAAFHEWTDTDAAYWVTGPVPGPCVITECVARLTSSVNNVITFAMALGLVPTLDAATMAAAKHLVRRGSNFANRQPTIPVIVAQRSMREITRRPFVMVPSGVRYLYCHAVSDNAMSAHAAFSEVLYLDLDEYRALYAAHRTVSILPTPARPTHAVPGALGPAEPGPPA